MADLRDFVGSMIDVLANVLVVLGIGGVIVFGGFFVVGLVTITLTSAWQCAWQFMTDRKGTDNE